MPDRPLSFCMVTTFYPPYHFGGDAMFVYRLSSALARRGHKVTVVHCTDAYHLLGGREPRSPLWSHPDVRVLPIGSRWGALSPLVTYLTGKPGLKAGTLSAVFRQERFDVVHFHNVSLIGGPGVLEYGSGVKLYTMHEHWLICPMHVLWRHNRELCDRPECLRCSLAFHRPPQLWRYGGILARELQHVDVFLSPSRFTAQMHRERGFPYPIRHLPHFLPLTEAADVDPAKPRGGDVPPTDRPYFLYVGRLEKMKGPQTLVEQFRTYAGADLVIAGEGSCGPALRRQAQGLPNIRFLGHVDPDRLRSLYAGAVALVVPTQGYEVFGMVVLEAFAEGTPVIVRDLGALPELVQDSGGGLTYRSDSELRAAMDALCRDPSLRGGLGSRGRDAHRRLWTEEPHMQKYFEVIEEARERAASERSGSLDGGAASGIDDGRLVRGSLS